MFTQFEQGTRQARLYRHKADGGHRLVGPSQAGGQHVDKVLVDFRMPTEDRSGLLLFFPASLLDRRRHNAAPAQFTLRLPAGGRNEALKTSSGLGLALKV